MWQEFVGYLIAVGNQFGYGGIIFLMALESSFFPFPSEVVIPPAAYLAYLGKMNIYLVILSGALGSVIGAVFNYFFALFVGRTIIYKLSEKKIIKFFLFNREKLDRAESYFIKNAALATFVCRLIPAIRQLISLPAGFFKMNFIHFVFYTFCGSLIWCAVLGILGYAFGANQKLLTKYYLEISIVFTVAGIIFFVFYFLKRYRHRKF